ncbi:MAG: hypothetical protein P4L96_10145 [Rhodoferax sp.]|nr:hypothetical protein [Rhodoferax sp.]
MSELKRRTLIHLMTLMSVSNGLVTSELGWGRLEFVHFSLQSLHFSGQFDNSKVCAGEDRLSLVALAKRIIKPLVQRTFGGFLPLCLPSQRMVFNVVQLEVRLNLANQSREPSLLQGGWVTAGLSRHIILGNGGSGLHHFRLAALQALKGLAEARFRAEGLSWPLR